MNEEIFQEHKNKNEMLKYLLFMGYYASQDQTIGRMYEAENFGNWGIDAYGHYYTGIWPNGINKI